VAPHLDFLLERRYVIDHEDLLLTVAVRPAETEPGPATTAMAAAVS
jgi:hypothetical protein